MTPTSFFDLPTEIVKSNRGFLRFLENLENLVLKPCTLKSLPRPPLPYQVIEAV
ncbi:hypothetical protein BGZ60DRAFT_400130 [Tricladium varicosporioides]|nr:hypothetical protein BGZ60DRAFT_400130 [Hymenoscyphus varicosporioides]